MSYYDRKCKYCDDIYCYSDVCLHYRQKPVTKGRVCVGCGYACRNFRLYNKDCLGYKDGIDKSKQKTYYREKYTSHDYNGGNC